MKKIHRIMPMITAADPPSALRPPPSGLGTRMSRHIQAMTGKKPCGTCKKIAKAIDRFEKMLKR